MTPITSHFCLEEFTASATAKAKGIANYIIEIDLFGYDSH